MVVELSSVNIQGRFPAEKKIDKYHEELTGFAKHRKIILENMQSVTGCLQFDTSVIISGKAFWSR